MVRPFSWLRDRSLPPRAGSAGFLGVVLMMGCDDISRFDTTDGSAYCGGVVGASFVRQSFEHRPRLQLELDTDNLGEFPGQLTTDDQSDGPCAPSRTFDEAELRISQKLQADPLSALQFGETREFNFLSWVDSECDGTYLAAVSLMKSDRVEVRLMRSEASEDGAEQGPFGVFRLTRFDDKCGF